MQTQITTVAQFATACTALDNNAIYELFEDTITQELRDTIYSSADADSCEPCRSALNNIGCDFNVQSLIDY